MKLERLQVTFRRALLEDASGALVRRIKGPAAEARERIRIHQNTVRLTLAAALADNFPVLHKLVGEDFFRVLARHYMRQHPPRSPVLAEYGAEMPQFVATFRGAKDHPYLAEMARFELAVSRCSRGPDAVPLNPARLQRMDFDRLENLVFIFLPTLILFESRYPVLEIWRSNRPGYAGATEISLDQGGCRLALYRPELEVMFLPLEDGLYRFIRRLGERCALGEALGHVLAEEPDFDLEGALSLIFVTRLLETYSYVKEIRHETASG